jgi:hypothetical protein
MKLLCLADAPYFDTYSGYYQYHEDIVGDVVVNGPVASIFLEYKFQF